MAFSHRFSLLLSSSFLLIFLSTSLNAQDKVNWMSWEDAVEKSKTEKKKVFVDIYTEWCGWCKKMDKATFQNEVVVKYMNENYYSVKFDAEQRETIQYRGKEYKYVKGGRRGYNTLAAELTRGRLSYPTIVFLDENLKVIQPIPGFRDKTEFEVMMTFFAGDHYKTTPWKTYINNYVPINSKKKTSQKYSRTVINN